MHKRFRILNVNVSAVNLNTACEVIDGLIRERKQGYVCVAPVSTIVSCQEDEEYCKVINQADLVTPDGMPLVWLAKLKGYSEVNRTYGPDLMRALCDRGQQRGYKHFLYGGTPQTCEKLESFLKEAFPQIKIVGRYSPPFRELTEEENHEISSEISTIQPDILWVGLGSPKQDFWMNKNCGKLRTPVMIGVGAAFDFLSGVKKQAPCWMQRCGLEWFFRLCNEPQRLWKRYLVGNTKFIYFLIKTFFKKEKMSLS